MNFATVCSGIEAASVAWHPLGWRPIFFAEIAAFPSAVLRARWPSVPNLGDFTQIGNDGRFTVDLIAAGTPCQSFSVAGIRTGLADDRGNLALQFLRLADRLRPRWVVWENVPGAMSTNGGRDFGSIIGGLAELRYGFAFRVLDAAHFGVPQRRARVFVVGHLGNWQRAAAVLFESHSLSWNPAAGGDPWQTAAPGTEGSPDADDIVVINAEGGATGLPFLTAANLGKHVNNQTPIVTHPQHPPRRLTVRECERLQGFPDDYTLVPFPKKLAKDGPRFRALGNSMAVPVMRWIGERIQAVEDLRAMDGAA